MKKNGRKVGLVKFGTLVALGISLSSAAAGGRTQEQVEKGSGDGAAMSVEGKFYCNVKALSAAERARHELLTKKLQAKRQATVETEKGYEFQYSPADVTVGEVAEWVVTESKCCPFFDFHIDLEEQGKLVCLRLTGAEGIKQFIRAEFNLS